MERLTRKSDLLYPPPTPPPPKGLGQLLIRLRMSLHSATPALLFLTQTWLGGGVALRAFALAVWLTAVTPISILEILSRVAA